ncbi:MAG: Si-specific NAD(P)(+) transhydrogenase [Acidobacteria bacterium]|nr:MAG: Si-specific NAD(P)(+) transhydrogenase [Acidobacteriota bacterium]
MIPADRYEVAVIGGGPAGHHAAIQAAKLGKRVALVDARPDLGGTCVHTGTIPSKTLREAILYLTGFRQRGIYGATYAVKANIAPADLTFRIQHVVRHEAEVFRLQLQRNRVELIRGLGSFLDSHRLRVQTDAGDRELDAETIILACGTSPASSEQFPVDGKVILDSDTLPSMPSIPRTMTIVGAGVIGVEYACMMAALGTKVTLVEQRAKILEFADGEIVDTLCYHMREMGVVFRLGEEVERVGRRGDGCVVASLKSRKEIVSAAVLHAVGRQGNTAGLNLRAAGLEADARERISVDEHFRTSVPHIYAAGDIIGFPSLASSSMEQGRVAACQALGKPVERVADLLPYGIYTIPEMSFVGKNESELTVAGIPYEVGVARYREIARGQILGDEQGILKLIFHAESGKLLGVHIVGEGACEIVHIGQAVLAHQGSLDFFLDNVFNYPTLAEAYKVAALDVANRRG